MSSNNNNNENADAAARHFQSPPRKVLALLEIDANMLAETDLQRKVNIPGNSPGGSPTNDQAVWVDSFMDLFSVYNKEREDRMGNRIQELVERHDAVIATNKELAERHDAVMAAHKELVERNNALLGINERKCETNAKLIQQLVDARVTAAPEQKTELEKDHAAQKRLTVAQGALICILTVSVLVRDEIISIVSSFFH
jgi:hypothetical protein